MSRNEQFEEFAQDLERDINAYVIKEYEGKMPIRLIDTYTGLILRRSEITSLLKERREYRDRLRDVIQGDTHPIGPPSQRSPTLRRLQAFIAEYLAFAMFSHRWGNREIVITDVRQATGGIYSIVHAPSQLPEKLATDFLDGAKKLQEFCCVAAKCGFRWAWSDTCCIDDQVYGEKSESLNSMFLWYRSSDLTVVYLGDVEDVKQGRFSASDSEDGDPWFADQEIQDPFAQAASYPYSPNTSDTVTTLYDCSRLGSPLQLQTMRPDTQVEAPDLEDHLKRKFPYVPAWKARHIYRGVPVWVTRGWTLQEMVASKRLRFYSKDWSLLEEADDRDTDEAEKMISISSFKYRARLVDHRVSPIWSKALEDTTSVPQKYLVKFEPGPKDIKDRLCWAARRTTEKVEDMAYCLLGIFDVSLPAMYGEGQRAFFRLQEELMKRTGDTSLFDWCGPRSSVNSFLAYRPECFIEPRLPSPHIDDLHGSTFRMLLDMFRVISGTMMSGLLAAVREAKESVGHIVDSPPPGHSLVNGELNLPLFEHQVRSCKPLKGSMPESPYFHYILEVDGLQPTHVTLESHAPNLMEHPTQYYLCRVWNQDTHTVFQVLLELMEYVLKDEWNKFWGGHSDSADSEPGSSDPIVEVKEDEPDELELKLREETQMKRKQVMEFFQHPFPAFLICVYGGRRIRVNTVCRIKSDYTKFDFKMPVVMRWIL